MKRLSPKPFLIAGLLVVAGISGGMMLGNFTTGDGAAQVRGISASTLNMDAPEQTAVQPVLASVTSADGPANYVCKGCGPSLAEQKASADVAAYAHASDPADLPPYPSADEGGHLYGQDRDGASY